MPKVYLIGGTPRTGKSTLSMRFIQQKPLRMMSADAVRQLLRDLHSPSNSPELFRFAKYISDDPVIRDKLMNDHQLALAIQSEESKIVWRSILSIIRSNIEDGYDVMIEGLAIMPAFIKELQCDYSAVFLGNQSEEHSKTVLKCARQNPKDWMHSLSDETIMKFASLNRTYSRFMEQQSRDNQLPYMEIHDNSFDADIDRALSILLS